MVEVWTRDLPIVEADPDLLRRGIRSAWRHTHWILAGSALWAAGLLLGLHTAEGSLARAVVTAGILTVPGTGLLTVIGARIVLEADCDMRAIRAVRRRSWLRVLHVPLIGAMLLIFATGSMVALPGMPSVLGWPAVTLSVAALLAYALLAPAAAALALHRSEAPHVRLWLVAFLATGARPIPILGGLSAVGLLAMAAWHVQILLFLAPGVAAIVLTASAWVALARVGINPWAGAGQVSQDHQELPELARDEQTQLGERTSHR